MEENFGMEWKMEWKIFGIEWNGRKLPEWKIEKLPSIPCPVPPSIGFFVSQSDVISRSTNQLLNDPIILRRPFLFYCCDDY